MIEIKSKKMSYGINFPSSVKEITADMLNTVTESIKLPKHYCIIALCFETKLFDFCTMVNTNRDANISVTPILAKISKEDSEIVNAEVGDKIIIDRSSLERGVHINIKTVINSNSVRRYFQNNSDLAKSIITKANNKIGFDKNINKELIASQSTNIIVLEFKICPVTDIAAAIPINCNSTDPFLIKDDSVN